jgi:hypothetical protein
VELTLEKITTGKAIIRSSDIEAENSGVLCFLKVPQVTRVNSTNVLDEGLRIGEIGRRMNSKVKLVEIGVYRK